MRNLCVVAALTVGGALNAAAQPPQAPTGLFLAAPPGAMVTVEGCVTRDASAAQLAAGERELAAATQFVLTQRTRPTPMVPDGRPSAGAPSMGEQKLGRKLYVLVAQDGDSADFGQHLNHIVKVTGVAAAPKSTPPLAGRAPDAPPVPGAAVGATGTPFGTTNVPRLAVTTFVMVSSTCH